MWMNGLVVVLFESLWSNIIFYPHFDHDYDTEEDNGDDEDINWYAEDDADDEDENGDAGDINMDAALVMRKMMLMTKT